ncbi:MAG: fibronectin type III domain-containing protein [Paludibacteraceae bacterium]|nr:fibronectin type III domain-containing protein [Paludibacteraceae bacterium]
MKHNSFILTCLFAIFMAMPVFADNPVYGYALFGEVPYKYTDLTGNVEVSLNVTGAGDGITASDYSDALSSIAFTGKGLGGSYVCHQNVAVSVRFKENQTMTLTDKQALHIVVKRTDDKTSGVLECSMTQGNWGGSGSRLSYEIANSKVTTDYSEVVLNYATDLSYKGTYSSYNIGNFVGTKPYPGGNGKEIFRFCAVSGEQFEISQIYIDASTEVPDPVKPSEDDKDAPTEFSAEVKSGSVKAVEATVTVSAKDANSPITFKFYDTEEGTTPAYTTTSNSGVAKDYTITGLTPETPYTFYVEAVDPSGNATTRQTVTFTTTEQIEKRYYFVRSGDLPVIEKMTAVDLRATTYSTWSGNPAPVLGDEYAAITLPTQWFAAVLKPKTQCMDDVTKENWSLKIKFKTDAQSLGSNNLRINLKDDGNNPNFFIESTYGDGEWHEKIFALKDAASTLPTYPISANAVALQIHASGNLNGTYFYIEYAYLTNVPTNPEKPAIVDNDPPTDVSIAVKDGSLSYDRLTLQLSANDEDTPITYAVKYQVKNSGDWTEVPTFTGTQGTTVEKEITGLAPETTYTFSVVASDPNGNTAEAVTTEATTTKLAEKRYYFFRTGDLPATTADLVAVDMRDGVGSTIIPSNTSKVTDRLFATYLMPENWGFVQVKANAKSLDDVTSDWYLCVRYKSQHPGDVYANVACTDKQQVKIAEKENNDNLWKTKQIKIAEFTQNPSSSIFPVSANSDMFQFQTLNGGASVKGEFAVDYVYLTNSIAAGVDAGYVDGTAPVVTVEEKATTATAVTLTISGTDDSDSKIVYTFSDGTNSEEVTKNSGETFDYTFENLTKGTEYTFTVDAKDLSNNAMTQISKTITTPGGETKPVIQKFESEVTPTTITLTFNATDEDTEHPLTYNISDGTNNYQVQETQGVDVVYTLKGLTPGTEYDLTLTATNASENTSDPSVKDVTTTYLKPSEFGVKIATVDMYNCVGHIAGDQLQTTMEYRVVTYKNYILFQHKVLGEGQSVSIGDWNNQMWVGEYPLETGRKEFAAKYNPFDSRVRLTEEQLTMDNTIGNEFDFDMYASDIFGVSGATCSQMQHFICGYINTPSTDTEAPSIFSVNHEDKDGKRYLTIDANDNNNTTKDVFYYVKEGDNEYISLQTVVVPIKSDVTYECYAVDWNGNKSEKYEVHISAATIQLADNVDNQSTINSWNSKLVNAKLTRTLSNAYYNTLCLPFGVEAEQIVEVMGEGTKIAQLETARIKDNDELYLGFSFTDHIEAGVPYFVQPAQNVENPTFADVTISKTLQPTVIDGVITFNGIYNPTQLQAETDESHTILMLVADNQLTFPNVAGTLNGMRAYFNTSGSVAHVARRASFGFDGDETGLNEAQFKNDNPQTKHQKVLENGQMLIIRQGTQYTILGQEIKK